MLRTKVKWADPLTLTAIVGVIAGIGISASMFFAIKTGNKNYSLTALILMIIFVVLFYRAIKTPGLILENDFDGKVRYKPEDGCDPEELKQLPARADGVNTGIKPKKVFKIRSGTNVYIDKTGNIRSYSPISAWVNKWVSKNDFTIEELACWKKLF